MPLDRIEAMSVLNLTEGYTEEQLRRAYKYAAKKAHPDVAGGSDELFVKVKKAFDLLSISPLVSGKNVFTHQSIFTIIKSI